MNVARASLGALHMSKPTKPARAAKPVNLTVAILREIRDELHATRVELSGRIDSTNTRLDAGLREVGDEIRATRVELSERIGAVEAAFVDLAQQQRFVVRKLGAGRERDTRLERHIEALDARVGALEAKARQSR